MNEEDSNQYYTMNSDGLHDCQAALDSERDRWKPSNCPLIDEESLSL